MTPLLHYTILVDGYNLAHQHPEWRRLRPEQAREQVLQLLRQTRWPFPSARITVVFDAKSPEAGLPASARGGIQVRFAASADAEIQEAIRDSASPGRMAVVSDDGEILRTAKSHGARCFSCAWVIQHSVTAPSTKGSRPHDRNDKSSLPASQARSITEELERRWLGENP